MRIDVTEVTLLGVLPGFGVMARLSPVVPPELSTEDAHAINSAFCFADSDSKGYLTAEDVRVAVLALFGYKPSKSEIDKMFQSVHEGLGCASTLAGLNLKQFRALMHARMVAVDQDDEIRQMFLLLDSHGRGFLTSDDVQRAFNTAAPGLTQHRLDLAFREVDQDGDGRISYKDFAYMMKYAHEDRSADR